MTKWRSLFVFCCILFSIVQLAEGTYYCYEVVRDINRPLATNDCAPPLIYQPSVQLCCAQQPVPNANLQQTYEQIPAPGSPGAIPDRCERALHFPSGMVRCRAGLVLRQVGATALCCQPDVVLPPGLTGVHAPITVTNAGQVRSVCAPNQQRVTTPNGVVCADRQTFWDPQRMCCAITVAGQQPIPGARMGGCQDLAVPGRASDCPDRFNLCDHPMYRDLMTQQCPKTCKRCGLQGAQFANAGGMCVDRVGPNGRSDCPDRIGYCDQPLYRTLMAQECPFTCKLCSLGPRRLGNVGPIGPGGIRIPPGLQIPGGGGTPLGPLPPPPAPIDNNDTSTPATNGGDDNGGDNADGGDDGGR